MKEIVCGKEAKKKMFSGIEKLASVVGCTLGPKGKNVALKSEFSDPVIINDGVSIAKEIELEDPIENLGASLIKEVALKTNDVAGDGTTTATILAYSMVNEGIRQIESGANEVKIRNGMNKALEKSLEILKNISQRVDSNDEIREIAKISSGSEEAGNLIFEAINMIGKEGVITTEESKTNKTSLDIVEGTRISSGYISSYMIDNEFLEEDLENPYILITNKKVNNVDEILPIIEKVNETERPLVLIVEDIEGEALATLIVNKMRKTFNSVAVKAPSFGEGRNEILEDVALVTGGKFLDSQIITSLRDVNLEDLGQADLVKISKDNTIILRGKANKDKLESKIEKIKKEILTKDNDYEVTQLKKRLARLLGGIALIQVGAQTQTELKEKKLRIEDALCATRAAIEEGIVNGGGVAYIEIEKELINYIKSLDEDERCGADVVLKSLEKPLYFIAQNSGQSGQLVVEKVKENNNLLGYDALNNKYVNMKKSGIIDPAKVVRIALESAVSISSLILTTDACVCQKETRES